MLITTIQSMTSNRLPRLLHSAKLIRTIAMPTTSTARMTTTAKKAKRKSSNPSAATTFWKKSPSAPSARDGSIKFRK